MENFERNIIEEGEKNLEKVADKVVGENNLKKPVETDIKYEVNPKHLDHVKGEENRLITKLNQAEEKVKFFKEELKKAQIMKADIEAEQSAMELLKKEEEKKKKQPIDERRFAA